MIADNAPDIFQVILKVCGDAYLGRGGTQKFQKSEFTRLVIIGQSLVISPFYQFGLYWRGILCMESGVTGSTRST